MQRAYVSSYGSRLVKSVGVFMKELKEIVASVIQLALGFWWDSIQPADAGPEQVSGLRFNDSRLCAEALAYAAGHAARFRADAACCAAAAAHGRPAGVEVTSALRTWGRHLTCTQICLRRRATQEGATSRCASDTAIGVMAHTRLHMQRHYLYWTIAHSRLLHPL